MIKQTLSLFLLSLLVWPFATSQASSTILSFSDDSAEVNYQTNIKKFAQQDTRQRYSLIYSQEPAPRNFLLTASVEFTQHSYMVARLYPLRPTLGILVLNMDEQTINAIPLGAILRFPINEKRRFDGLIETFAAPLFANAITNDWPTNYQLPWIMGIRLQLNYPLPEDTELNFGYKNIRMKIDRNPIKAYEQGFFLGITNHF